MIEGAAPVVKTKTVPASSRASFSMADDIGQADASIMVTGDIPVIPERAMYRNNRREGHDSIGTTTPAATMEQAVHLPTLSQVSINPAAVVGQADFSTHVRCTSEHSITVDRTMTWTGQGALSSEGHSSIGAQAPGSLWFMSEGSSNWGFETWTLVENPGDTDTQVRMVYMIEGQEPRAFDRVVPAHTRATYNMADDIGAADASVVVSASEPVVAESSMYRNNRREGQCSVGANQPSDTFYLAEGTPAWGFTTWVLIMNPNDEPANVDITYMTGGGPVAQPTFQMPPNSRSSIDVNAVPGMANLDFSTMIHASQPIVASRAMYWNNGTGQACHGSIGVTGPHQVFYLPDGKTTNGDETWTLVQNPNNTDVLVQVSYLLANGGVAVRQNAHIPADSRMTFNMAACIPNGSASVMVVSLTPGKKIIA